MPDSNWIAIIVTISLFLIGHIITTVWWGSRIDTLLSIAIDQLKNITTEVSISRDKFSTKEEVAIALQKTEKDIILAQKSTEKEVTSALAIVRIENAAMWKNIDELKEKVYQ